MRAVPTAARVFVSHSSKNKSLAAAVAAELESNGIPCWMAPRDIKPGEPNYGKAIIDGLTSCRAMVLLLTDASNRSQHVMKEAERAVNRNIPILVVRFQPIDVSRELEYYVSSAQFLDATAPPPQQHLRAIRDRVREMVAGRESSPPDVAVRIVPRPSRRRPRWGLRLAGLGGVGVAALAAWMFVGPALRSSLSDLTSAIPGKRRSSPPDDTATNAPPHPNPNPTPTPTPTPTSGGGSLLEGVEEKARTNGALAAFAKSRLANFHREALLITKSGTLAPGKVSDTDVEVMASCRLQPNMNGYTSLANDLIRLLDKTSLQNGTITSDGLRTSENQGRDARPIIQEIARDSLGSWSGLLGIFASNAHETLVRQETQAGQCRYASFSTVFMVFDERITGNYRNGIYNLQSDSWYALLRQQGSGIVVLLESTRNSFRHTTWRWFHLSPSDWTVISTSVPRRFKCVLTLTDPSGAPVESDYYPLKQYGVGRLDDDRVLSLAPFFVNDDFEHYIPEITLTKSVVVLRDDVPRVKDFTATIEEIREASAGATD